MLPVSHRYWWWHFKNSFLSYCNKNTFHVFWRTTNKDTLVPQSEMLRCVHRSLFGRGLSGAGVRPSSWSASSQPLSSCDENVPFARAPVKHNNNNGNTDLRPLMNLKWSLLGVRKSGSSDVSHNSLPQWNSERETFHWLLEGICVRQHSWSPEDGLW